MAVFEYLTDSTHFDDKNRLLLICIRFLEHSSRDVNWSSGLQYRRMNCINEVMADVTRMTGEAMILAIRWKFDWTTQCQSRMACSEVFGLELFELEEVLSRCEGSVRDLGRSPLGCCYSGQQSCLCCGCCSYDWWNLRCKITSFLGCSNNIGPSKENLVFNGGRQPS